MERKIPTWFKAFRMVIRISIPFMFLSTGLILLYLAIPGWSLVLGLPAIIFGIVFLLYAYDSITGQINYDETVEELAHKKELLQ